MRGLSEIKFIALLSEFYDKWQQLSRLTSNSARNMSLITDATQIFDFSLMLLSTFCYK